MGAAIELRVDYDGDGLRRLARRSRDADQTRRLLALAVIYEGGRRTDAARVGGVELQTIRDWVLRFNTGGPEELIDGKAPGGEPKLTPGQKQALFEIIERGVRQCRSDHWRDMAHPGDPRGGALATDRSGGVGVRRVRRVAERVGHEPHRQGARLCEALGPTASPRPERICH